MLVPFGLNFRLWVESSSIKDAVIGVVSGGQETLGNEEENHLLSRKTSEFSADIRARLKNLGVVKSIHSASARLRANQAIEDGITVSELIRIVGMSRGI